MPFSALQMAYHDILLENTNEMENYKWKLSAGQRAGKIQYSTNKNKINKSVEITDRPHLITISIPLFPFRFFYFELLYSKSSMTINNCKYL